MSVRTPLIAIALFVAVFRAAPAAEADDGTQAAGGAIATFGVLGGLTSSVAGFVYLAKDETFDTPWVIIALISSAACASAAFTVAGEAESGWIAIPTAMLLGLSIWPAYWTFHGAFSGVPPGEPLGSPPYVEPHPPLRLARSPGLRLGMSF